MSFAKIYDIWKGYRNESMNRYLINIIILLQKNYFLEWWKNYEWLQKRTFLEYRLWVYLFWSLQNVTWICRGVVTQKITISWYEVILFWITIKFWYKWPFWRLQKWNTHNLYFRKVYIFRLESFIKTPIRNTYTWRQNFNHASSCWLLNYSKGHL